ncbi:hypothetical protein NE857_02585 [Nocardiopsis exhalans]|uniref:Uncharacterized protein n=1 Tax=Nocardiopsis exhalans TaxID=163604 RepID=A0ABY5DB08_9ACTN|nr:hypothetical protein [Nocardiopsis exhalans]USY20560.1 hypothetical protein NE857_02585 [Nocardiopsis exhalans]
MYEVYKAPDRLKVELSGAVLYREDLKDICSIISQSDAEDFQLELRSGESWGKFSTPGGLSDDSLKMKLDAVKMSSRVGESTIKVTIGLGSSFVEVENPTSVTQGMAHVVKELCEERKHVLRPLLAVGIVFFGTIAVYRIGGFIPTGFMPNFTAEWMSPISDDSFQEEGLRQSLMIAYLIGSMLAIRKKKFTNKFDLFNWTKSESELFRDKVRVNWSVGLFWAAVGAFIGFLLGQIFVS